MVKNYSYFPKMILIAAYFETLLLKLSKTEYI